MSIAVEPHDLTATTVRTSHVPWLSLIEARVDDRVAGVLRYDVRGTWAVLAETAVDDDADRAVVGPALVAAALDLLRGRGHRILPACPWARTFLRSHPDRDGVDDVLPVPS